VPTSFLIVDDHPLFIEALKLVVQGAFPGASIDEATSIQSARAAIDRNPSFDIALLDLALPETHGLDGLLELRTSYPKLPIVIVSAMEDPRIVQEVLACGAAGFIPKSTRGLDLASAIRDVMAGSITLPKAYQIPEGDDRRCESDLSARLATLTPQQLRVLQMLRQGKQNKKIAHEFGVGEATIKAHVSEILRKLKVTSRTQAVIEAARIDFDAILSQRQDSDAE